MLIILYKTLSPNEEWEKNEIPKENERHRTMLSYKFVCPFVIPLAHRMETEGLHLFIHECPYRDIMMDVRIKITLLRLKKTNKSVYVICNY